MTKPGLVSRSGYFRRTMRFQMSVEYPSMPKQARRPQGRPGVSSTPGRELTWMMKAAVEGRFPSGFSAAAAWRRMWASGDRLSCVRVQWEKYLKSCLKMSFSRSFFEFRMIFLGAGSPRGR
jgi:hypothetical protein